MDRSVISSARRGWGASRIGLAVGMAAILCQPSASLAQDAAEMAAEHEALVGAADDLAEELLAEQRRLREIEAAAKVGQDTVQTLREETSRLRDDRAQLNSTLLETARSVSRLENEVGATEEQIVRLRDESSALQASLAARRGSLTETLRAMQRLGTNPPPAVFTAPQSALDAIRAARLLGVAMPALREQANALSRDLERLAAVTEAQETEHERLLVRLAALAEERTRTALLVEEKRRLLESSETELAEAKARAEELAGRATSLQDLIASMESDIASTRDAAEAAAIAARERRTEEIEALARQNTARLQPAIPFTAAKGLLPRPTSGVVTMNWGDADSFGGRAEGMTVVTRTGAQVVSPTDGWVVYAGPYRSYGQLVILNAGEEHHVLLAGMERIDVELGQFVLAGEPVAAMGGRLLASASALAPQSTQPALYIEFRKGGVAIDPTPWWADGTDSQKVRG